MGLSGKNAVNRSKTSEIGKDSENSNPNHTSPGSRFPKSSAIKSAVKTQKSASKTPKPSPRNKIRERKFVVAKRNSKKEKSISKTIVCKCKEKGFTSQKCLCVAYDNLRASQEEFFKNLGSIADGGFGEIDEENNSIGQTPEIANGYEGKSEEFDDLGTTEVNESGPNEIKLSGIMGSSTIKRRRDKLLEEARQSLPDAEPGRVMHLVNAFDRLLTIPKESDKNDERGQEDDDKKGMKWVLSGLQSKVPETRISLSSFCPSDFFVTSENLGLDSRGSSSSDSCHESFTISSRISGRGQRSRRNSSESSGCMVEVIARRGIREQPPKSPSSFGQRGRNKGEEFIKKLRQMITEEEKQHIPVAQGLPWTTDEPECLLKPPIKEITRPIDLVLHSDVRAMERAEFDQQMAEKMSLIEQYREERERQQKLAEEEEIKRLRKELVPRAQPMPYFDRPFIPRRSVKHPTIPKDPKFHILQHKKIKCCMSWNDMHSNNEMH